MTRSVRSLMLAVFLLEIGSGLQGVLIPIRGELAGFSTPVIGGLGALYYAGFVVGCLALPTTVRRVGHIRSYSALAAVAASFALLHALIVLPVAWMAFRVVIGFCFAGLFMVAESWLNELATSTSRGRILGQYMVATWVGVICGKLAFSTADPGAFDLFAIGSIAVGLSLVPISLTNGAVPAIPRPSRMAIADLYRLAPIGLVGSMAVGIANGAFWTFSPLFAQRQIGSDTAVSVFMAACVVGVAICQWPIGKLSDIVDRRWVIAALCVAAVATGVFLTTMPAAPAGAFYALGMLYGASALSIYSICVAHANDRADASDFVEVSSHLLLAFGVGAIIGPFAAGLLISSAGVQSLFLFTSCVQAALLLVVLLRLPGTEPVPESERVTFAVHPPISHGTQVIVELHPDPGDPAGQTSHPGDGSRARKAKST